MTDTATVTSINAPLNIEEFKTFFIQLLETDASFRRKIKENSQGKEKKTKKQERKPLPPAIPFSEMPYWKLRPNFVALDAKPYAIKKETILELQELWKDAPPIEELIAQLNA